MTMGRADHPFSIVPDLQAKRGPRIMAVISPRFSWTLGALDDPRLAGLRVCEAMPGDPLEQIETDALDLLVLEVAPDEQASLDRLSHFHQQHGDVPVIAAIHDASLTLVRRLLHEGVVDVVGLPLEHEELAAAVASALARPGRGRAATAQLAPMVAVMHSVGGCGATSVATHLAAALAGQEDPRGDGQGAGRPDSRSVALVDLDLQFGSVADRLSAHGRGSIRDLIEAGNRLDADLMAAIARPAASGIKVFAAPEEIRALEDVPTERMIDVLDLLRRHYGHVVLDLPLNLTNWLIFSLMGADAIVMVVEMTIPSLHQARRRLDLLRSIGVPDRHVHLVVNRVERRLFRTIGLQDVARTLGQTVLGSVALEAPAVAAAQERGELLIGHRGRFVSDIATIARRLTDVWQGGEA